MDKVLETSGSQRHIPLSKPFRIQLIIVFVQDWSLLGYNAVLGEQFPAFLQIVVHVCTNFPKVKAPPQNSRRQMDNTKQELYWGLTDIRYHFTKF
jgi:hypothetical protein